MKNSLFGLVDVLSTFLTAQTLLRRVSVARYTLDIPPFPISFPSSYLPAIIIPLLCIIESPLNNFYVYFKIPSEVIENFYYDVVIEFVPANELVKNDNSLSKYNIRFYSNDPSFVYTFAHAMKSNNMFINDLSSKMSKRLKAIEMSKNMSSVIDEIIKKENEYINSN